LIGLGGGNGGFLGGEINLVEADTMTHESLLVELIYQYQRQNKHDQQWQITITICT
jgi:hypothetical protein